jgi:hypothetical protein
MTDFVAQLYIIHNGDKYRIKVFDTFLMLERQPGGDNIRLDFDSFYFARGVYNADEQTWNIDWILSMITVEYQDWESYVERHVDGENKDIVANLAKAASATLPALEDIKAKNQRANGRFVVRYDGGGEYILLFIDRNGTIAGRPGEPVERLIQTYTGAPDPADARARAMAWLEANHSWL